MPITKRESMAENPNEIRRSWNLQANWQSGLPVINKLVPIPFQKIALNFVQTWREENVPTLDWGAKNFSVVIPEGVRCISAVYLEITLPSAKYRKYPGLYCIKNFRIRSAGNVVYECDYNQYLADHCESLIQQKLDSFSRIYLGGKTDSTGAAARTVKLPLLLPNSTYMRRSSMSTAGHGVFGAFTGGQRIELCLDMEDALCPGLTGGDADPTSIAGACKIMYHCVHVPTAVRKKYEDLRGFFGLVTRRFLQLHSGWKTYNNANTIVTDALSQPNGTCTEVMILAVPQGTDNERRHHDYIQPTHFEVIHDMVVQKSLDSPNKVSSELYTNGFNPPADFASPGRLCFASHCSTDSTQIYTGGYDMSQATTLQFRFKFDQAVDYRLVAVQYANCKIDGNGTLTSTLDGV
jgi:hypothetical protein